MPGLFARKGRHPIAVLAVKKTKTWFFFARMNAITHGEATLLIHWKTLPQIDRIPRIKTYFGGNVLPENVLLLLVKAPDATLPR